MSETNREDKLYPAPPRYPVRMPDRLPPLRRELEIMPSPAPGRPGVLIRDPFQFSEHVLIIPPVLARCLHLFDGEHDRGDIGALLTRITGEIRTREAVDHLIETLDQCGFLASETFFEVRDAKVRAFAEAPEKRPAHAGSAYPDDPEALRARFDEYGAKPSAAGTDGIAALAAPHVSPEGGYRSYAAAYQRLGPEHASKTFVILGTSHYGRPETFGLTMKPYCTPLGAVETDTEIVGRLSAAAPGAVLMEDYCHSSEHSIEFQAVFLHHVLGPALSDGERLRAVPILCGPFAESLVTGKPPEENEQVRRFFDALAELAEERRDSLLFVLGVDMAHIGRRYGDSFAAIAGEGRMTEVRRRDEERIERICAGDAAGYYELTRPNQDDLRWCGYSPIYTFLATVPGRRGRLLEYEQWNIDEQSAVSFAGIEFVREG